MWISQEVNSIPKKAKTSLRPLKNQLKLHIGLKESLESNRFLGIPIRAPKHQMLTKDNHKSKFLQFHNLGTQILKKYQIWNWQLSQLKFHILELMSSTKKSILTLKTPKDPKTIFLNNLVSKAHKHIKFTTFNSKFNTNLSNSIIIFSGIICEGETIISTKNKKWTIGLLHYPTLKTIFVREHKAKESTQSLEKTEDI